VWRVSLFVYTIEDEHELAVRAIYAIATAITTIVAE